LLEISAIILKIIGILTFFGNGKINCKLVKELVDNWSMYLIKKHPIYITISILLV